MGLYATGTCYLVLVYLRHAFDKDPSATMAEPDLPKVAVQLPLYNERYVARRLIDAVAQLDYPHDRLIIQVLDDSTDDTTELIQGRIAQLRAEGLKIELVHRADRTGYKAGALANAMKQTDAPFFAIFDADFIPPTDFLRRTVPLFQDPTIGMVQTRWGHLNEQDNILTRAQALAIDGHFGVEQFARYHDGIVFSFNGTGGVWRRATIESAGGWSADTLCEDFDLSYRATFKGWKYAYLRNVCVPGELPSQMASYKQQQSRWAKGSTQVLLKLAPSLFRSNLSIRNKLLGFMQMMQYAIQMFMLVLLLLTPPMIALGAFHNLTVIPYSLLALSAPLLYFLGQVAIHGKNWWRRSINFIPLLLMCSGMSLNNGRAAISAMLGLRTEFKRTPKFHQDGQSNRWTRAHYTSLLAAPDLGGETFMLAYSLLGFFLAMELAPGMMSYMLFYVAAFGSIVGWSLFDRWLVIRPQRHIEAESVPGIGR
jgi:cellulose synthase/poly-beta-1,6-N-acetylglucosamine synthase-like glycosyltransferase